MRLYGVFVCVSVLYILQIIRPVEAICYIDCFGDHVVDLYSEAPSALSSSISLLLSPRVQGLLGRAADVERQVLEAHYASLANADADDADEQVQTNNCAHGKIRVAHTYTQTLLLTDRCK